MGTCTLCGEERALVRSHIIPLAFHRHVQSVPDKPPVVIGSAANSFPQRSPGGIYDEELLCDPCEQRFGPWDQYGAECLLQRWDEDAKTQTWNSEVFVYEVDNWDEARLRMFVLSLLWRAAVTTKPFFRRVTLGPPIRLAARRHQHGKDFLGRFLALY
jgi:hypothetical protein